MGLPWTSEDLQALESRRMKWAEIREPKRARQLQCSYGSTKSRCNEARPKGRRKKRRQVRSNLRKKHPSHSPLFWITSFQLERFWKIEPHFWKWWERIERHNVHTDNRSEQQKTSRASSSSIFQVPITPTWCEKGFQWDWWQKLLGFLRCTFHTSSLFFCGLQTHQLLVFLGEKGWERLGFCHRALPQGSLTLQRRSWICVSLISQRIRWKMSLIHLWDSGNIGFGFSLVSDSSEGVFNLCFSHKSRQKGISMHFSLCL